MTRALLDDMVQISRLLDFAVGDPFANQSIRLARIRAVEAIQRHTTQEETEMNNPDNEYRTLAAHNVGEGDVVALRSQGYQKATVARDGDGKLILRDGDWSIPCDMCTMKYRVLSRAPKPEQRKTYWALNGEVIFDADEVTKDEALSFADGGPIERVEVVETIQPEPQPPREWVMADDGSDCPPIFKSFDDAEKSGFGCYDLIHVREVTE
jgi:hypothetical protein